MHEELVPPESLEGLSQQEAHRIKMEYDVLWGLEKLGHDVRVLGIGDELAPIRRSIESWKPHIAFNLMMHFHGVGIYDAHVVGYLELLRVPYTGCNPRGLHLAGDKALSKKILTYHRIAVPRFRRFRVGTRRKLPANMPYPMIVKSAVEHSSTGIAQASIVHDDEGLLQRVEFMHRTVGTDVIAEQYIDGREVTVGVLGNQRLTVFDPWELHFDNLPEGSEPIATSKMKWDLAYQKKIGVRTAAAEDLGEAKNTELKRLAKRVYRALDLSGFARIDLRLDAEGRPYVLEANPNPDLCLGEDFAESADRAGTSYPELLQRLLTLGLAYQPAWKEG